MNEVVNIANLSKVYRSGFTRKKYKAVNNLSFSVEGGSVVGLVGPNGAGKSTTIYCMLGLLFPDEGSVRLFGEAPQSKAVRRRIGFQSEIFHTYDFLKPKEAIRLYGRLSGMPVQALDSKIDEMLDRFGLEGASNRKIKSFSKGMKQRLGMVQALLHDPDLIILDEPSTGLDPEGRKVVSDIIFEEKAKGKTIFFSSHNLRDVERLCDRVIMIRKGEVVVDGSLSDITTGDGRWCISVNDFDDFQTSALESFKTFVEINSDKTEIICRQDDKKAVIRALLDSQADIIGIRKKTKSLEELYMELDTKAQETA